MTKVDLLFQPLLRNKSKGRERERVRSCLMMRMEEEGGEERVKFFSHQDKKTFIFPTRRIFESKCGKAPPTNLTYFFPMPLPFSSSSSPHITIYGSPYLNA